MVGMNKRRNLIPLMVLALLLIALPILGLMQYRWLDAVSENEMQRLERNINAAVRQIRSEIGFEFASIATLFAPDPRSNEPGSLFEQVGEEFAEYYQTWIDGSRFPDLVESVFLIDHTTDPALLYRFAPDSKAFDLIEGSPPQTVATFLDQQEWAPRNRLTADPMVLAMPVGRIEPWDGSQPSPKQFEFTNLGFVIVQVDRHYLAEVVAPELADNYLGTQSGGFDIAVVDDDSEEVLFSKVAESDLSYGDLSAETRKIDAIVSLNAWSALTVAVIESSGRFDEHGMVGEFDPRVQAPVVQQWLSLRSRNEGGAFVGTYSGTLGEPPRDGRTVAFEPQLNGINLYVWHSSGSIREAATSSRNRNLLISYLVLGGLATAAVVFYLLFRRANFLRDREHEFVATVTHELRTPVSAMSAVADNLAEGIVREPERVQEYGRTLLGEGRRLRALIDQVLLYAGLSGSRQNQKWNPTDVEEIVASVASRIPELPRDRLITRVAPDLPTYRGDPVAVETVISNLLSNAGKHNDPTTTVTLRVYGESRGGRNNLVIHVSDKGRGIPRRELSRIKEPFFRGAQSQADQVSGTGLGLSLIARIVATYGGSMSIESIVGRGTTVTVRLPFERGAQRGGPRGGNREA